jgi:hypothetical protein
MIVYPLAALDHNDPAWKGIDNPVKEERPLQPFHDIVVSGSIDVVFRRCDKPMLVVTGETFDAVASVKTYISSNECLVIERQEDVGSNVIVCIGFPEGPADLLVAEAPDALKKFPQASSIETKKV